MIVLSLLFDNNHSYLHIHLCYSFSLSFISIYKSTYSSFYISLHTFPSNSLFIILFHSFSLSHYLLLSFFFSPSLQFLSFNGRGGASGDDSVLIAYDALLHTANIPLTQRWTATLEHSALHSGDSDSTAAIACSLFVQNSRIHTCNCICESFFFTLWDISYITISVIGFIDQCNIFMRSNTISELTVLFDINAISFYLQLLLLHMIIFPCFIIFCIQTLSSLIS